MSLPCVGLKLLHRADHCTWGRIIQYGPDMKRLSELVEKADREVQPIQEDISRNLQLFQTPLRSLWTVRENRLFDVSSRLAGLIAEHLWLSALHPDARVEPGDIVLDCGAHVGVFTALALNWGAARVIAIEPAPENLYCLRRNFPAEIADNRIAVVEKGVWSSEGLLDLRISNTTSTADSFVQPGNGDLVKVPVTTIDNLVDVLNLPRVDYIKLDIEGAEREALSGARETLRRYHPKVMVAMYHRPDDRIVLPEVIRSAYAGYRHICGPCEYDPGNPRELIPHVSYFLVDVDRASRHP